LVRKTTLLKSRGLANNTDEVAWLFSILFFTCALASASLPSPAFLARASEPQTSRRASPEYGYDTLTLN
jgi:hypothetical protein